MTENVNPSIVNDESGGNYSGINMGGGLAEASMAYLENLAQLAKTGMPKTQLQETYFPGYTPDVQVGAVSGPTIGTFPLFATGGGLLPWGMYDVMQNARAEAEAQYLAGLKKEIDKPLYTQKLELADPFRQPAFAAKVQETIDSYLDLYAKKYNGDMMMAYVATKSDPNFQKTMRMYGEYVNMFKQVYDKVLEIESAEKPENAGKIYVPPEAKKAADEFLYTHEQLEVLSPDQLYEKARIFRTKIGAIEMAKILTENIKDTTYQTDFKKTENMSTDELDAYLQTTTTNAGVEEEIIKNAEAAYPHLVADKTTKNMFESAVRSYVKNGRSVAIQTLKKNAADRDLSLRKLGWLDENGEIAQLRQPSALVNTIGEWALPYPPDIDKMPTTVGMVGYVVSDGRVHLVNIPGSYDFFPTAEYDVTRENTGVIKGRYIEGKINFETVDPYTPAILRAGAVRGQNVRVGEGKSTTEIKPAVLTDVYTNEEVKVIGETTFMVPYNDFRTKMEGSIPYLKYVHDKIDEAKGTYPYGGKREPYIMYPKTGVKAGKPVVSGEPIDLVKEGYSVEDIPDLNPDQMYIWKGKKISGQQLMDMYNAAINQ